MGRAPIVDRWALCCELGVGGHECVRAWLPQARARAEHVLRADARRAGLIGPLWLLLSGAIGVVSLAVAATDRGAARSTAAFALLLLAALLISPLGWTYYWWLVPRWWRSSPPGGAGCPAGGRVSQRTRRWRRRCSLSRCPAIWPLPAAIAFQPSAWATVFPGSAYFWATLALWGALIADWRAAGGHLNAFTGLLRR